MTVFPIHSNPQLATAAAKRPGVLRAWVVANAPARIQGANTNAGGIG
jgi:hypothetical protein